MYPNYSAHERGFSDYTEVKLICAFLITYPPRLRSIFVYLDISRNTAYIEVVLIFEIISIADRNNSQISPVKFHSFIQWNDIKFNVNERPPPHIHPNGFNSQMCTSLLVIPTDCSTVVVPVGALLGTRCP